MVSDLSPTYLQHLFNERGADDKAVFELCSSTLTMPLFIKHISVHIHVIPSIKCMTLLFINNFSNCTGVCMSCTVFS